MLLKNGIKETFFPRLFRNESNTSSHSWREFPVWIESKNYRIFNNQLQIQMVVVIVIVATDALCCCCCCCCINRKHPNFFFIYLLSILCVRLLSIYIFDFISTSIFYLSIEVLGNCALKAHACDLRVWNEQRKKTKKTNTNARFYKRII